MADQSNIHTLYYFAYGANTHPEVFRQRGMHPLKSECALLKDYRLVFNQPGMPWFEPGFGNIEPHAGSVVYGVLYELPVNEFKLLNRIEGNGAYKRKQLSVVGAASGEASAWVFWTDRVGSGLIPSRRYLRILIAGAKRHNFPKEWVAWLKSHPRAYIPLLSELNNLIVRPVVLTMFRFGMKSPFQKWRLKQMRCQSNRDQSSNNPPEA